MEVNDAAVVAQVLAGDRDAFRVLVERHSRSIFRVVYRMTGNQQDSEELVQETFLRAYKSLARFELRANFSTWLYRIAVNRTLDFLNARKTQMNTKDTLQIVDNPDPEEKNQVQLPAAGPGPERLLLSTEMKRKIAGAMGLLTPAECVAFTMRHMEGRSIEEISQTLNLKVSAAKNSVFRAVQKLRQQLEPYVPESPTHTTRWGGSATK
ncbi:MAG TPA: sigma-70 family RNA polymerase sigma factor [Candidatus Sulfotelmatobacter sp.]|nr:sigma-70 family RNA polymerase sigma factor [Candidatus Sulfotelmatobacter sp.]